MKLHLAAVVLLALLMGCTAEAPVRQGPTVSTQEVVVRQPLDLVYERLHQHMNGCRAVHNIFFPGDLVGGRDKDGAHARLFVAKGGVTLWGAELTRVPDGTKLVTLIGRDASSDRYHALLRGWAENRPSPPGYPEC